MSSKKIQALRSLGCSMDESIQNHLDVAFKEFYNDGTDVPTGIALSLAVMMVQDAGGKIKNIQPFDGTGGATVEFVFEGEVAVNGKTCERLVSFRYDDPKNCNLKMISRFAFDMSQRIKKTA